LILPPLGRFSYPFVIFYDQDLPLLPLLLLLLQISLRGGSFLQHTSPPVNHLYPFRLPVHLPSLSPLPLIRHAISSFLLGGDCVKVYFLVVVLFSPSRRLFPRSVLWERCLNNRVRVIFTSCPFSPISPDCGSFSTCRGRRRGFPGPPPYPPVFLLPLLLSPKVTGPRLLSSLPPEMYWKNSGFPRLKQEMVGDVEPATVSLVLTGTGHVLCPGLADIPQEETFAFLLLRFTHSTEAPDFPSLP